LSGCINRPDRRLHPTNRQNVELPLASREPSTEDVQSGGLRSEAGQSLVIPKVVAKPTGRVTNPLALREANGPKTYRVEIYSEGDSLICRGFGSELADMKSKAVLDITRLVKSPLQQLCNPLLRRWPHD
jgi:hypothetical protein